VLLRRRAAGLLLAPALVGSCAPSAPGPPTPSPTGPAHVRGEVVARHARQFAADDPEREAGSQGEQIAAAYLLAHLQRAGYRAFLDPVPVSNLVRSTNVVASPPSGRRPLVAVTVPYDTPAARAAPPGAAEALGVFLELARALAVARPQHRAAFVALGAERAEVAGGRLGSRRLVVYLRARSLNPKVVVLSDEAGRTAEVFEAAGLEVIAAPAKAGALLDLLESRAR
jgi:hypothetical protein